jgi:CTP:molybdopterin cytidylyltransferase MocA
MTTAAVVLAAGGGSRYAGPTHKLLADLRGQPVVLWAVQAALGASLDETLSPTSCQPRSA